MSSEDTSGYDVVFVVSDAEMGRLVQTAFLERPPAQGLPMELEVPVPFDIPDGSGGTTSLTGLFSARFDLPIVNFDPFRDTVDTFLLGLPQHPANTLEIRLPFRESAFTFDASNPGLGLLSNLLSNLRGDLSLIIPIGHPTNSDGDSVFGLDLERLDVWLRLADDDPDADADEKTTRDKVVEAFALTEQPWSFLTQTTFEDRLATQLRTSPMVAGLGGTGINLQTGACPMNAVDEERERTLSLNPPETILCVDVETFRPRDSPLSFLALKTKLAETSVNEGVDITSNELGHSWMGPRERASVLISDSFLLESMLPPLMIQALLREEFGRRSDEEQQAVAGEFFTAPLHIIENQSVPLRLPLPLVDEDDDTPNTFIEDVSLAIVPDPENAGNNMVQVTLVITGGVPWPEWNAEYYTFDATVRINVRFDTNRGRLALQVETDDNIQIDVHPHPLAYLITIGLGTLLLGVLTPFIGGLLGAGSILPAFLAVFVAEIVIEIISSFGARDVLNARLDAESPEPPQQDQVLRLLFHDAPFDDLILKGELVPEEIAAVSYEGFTPLGRRSWRLALERDRLDLPQLLANEPLLRDAFTGVDADEASVICEGTTIRPVGGTRLHDFGTVALWQARNLSQADLRNVRYNIEGAISAQPSGDIILQAASALIDPLAFEDSLALPLRTFGVQTQLGRFALLIVWNAGTNRLRSFYRRYNQALPGALLVAHFGDVRVVGQFPEPQTTRGPAEPRSYCKKGRDHSTTRVMPVGIADFMFPSPNTGLVSDGSVSVSVGYTEYECVTRGTFEAQPILLRRPLVFTWTVVTDDGERHILIGGPPTEIDLTVGLTGDPRGGVDSGCLVTFILSGPGGRLCAIDSQLGRSGSFTIEVQIVERGENTFTEQRRVRIAGKEFESFGFDVVSRILDGLHKGVRDPLTWPDLGIKVPGIRRDPARKPPDLRDQSPPPRRGWPDVFDPLEGGSFKSGGYLSRRYLPMAERSLPPEAVRAAYDPHISKGKLFAKTRRSFRELPDELRAQPSVKRYMASVLELVSSLPDPPDAGDAPRSRPQARTGWIQRCVCWFASLFGPRRKRR